MTSLPSDLRYTDTHLWVRSREKLVTVGVTQFVADQVGAIGFVEMPYAGELLKAGEPLGRMSSDTGAAKFPMPFVGQINSLNPALGDSPGVINSDPYGDGWMVRIEPADYADVEGLMDAAEYEAFISSQA